MDCAHSFHGGRRQQMRVPFARVLAVSFCGLAILTSRSLAYDPLHELDCIKRYNPCAVFYEEPRVPRSINSTAQAAGERIEARQTAARNARAGQAPGRVMGSAQTGDQDPASGRGRTRPYGAAQSRYVDCVTSRPSHRETNARNGQQARSQAAGAPIVDRATCGRRPAGIGEPGR